MSRDSLRTHLTRRDALRFATAFTFAGLTGLAQSAITSAMQPAATNPSTRILTKPIPSSGEELPVIGLGTWQTFNVGRDAKEREPLEEVLAAFIEMGGKVIDSSPMYGSSEQMAGDLIEKLDCRKKLFIATKVWTRGKDAGIEQMNDSMKKLRAHPIDLMQVHNLVDVDTHLATLRDWRQKGRIRYIGVTHYTASGHDAVAKIVETQAIDFIQINYSVGEREAEKRLLPLTKERKVAVIANRPFAGGDLLRRLKDKPLPAWAGEIDCTSWAQLLLKFVISHSAITCAIPATSKVAHLRDNMQAGLGRLPNEKQRTQIATAAVET
jgi:diketogulonate reductase-like aldo/keto reductase